MPDRNFTTEFSCVGGKEIEDIIDQNKIDYSKKTIIQASDLKLKLEELNISLSTHTITQINARKMHPSG